MTPLQLTLVAIFGLIQNISEYLLVSVALVVPFWLIKIKKGTDFCYISIVLSILTILFSLIGQTSLFLVSGLGVLLSSFFIARYLRKMATKESKRMATIIFVLIVGVLLPPFFTAFLQTISASNEKTLININNQDVINSYTNDPNHFMVTFPTGWTQVNNAPNVIILALSPDQQAGITVLTPGEVNQGQTIDSLFASDVQVFGADNVQKTVVSGQDAVLVQSVKNGNKQLDYFMIHDNVVYQVGEFAPVSSFDSFETQFNDAISSFQFL